MQVQQVISNLRQQARTLRSAEDSVTAAIKVLEAALPNGAVAKTAKRGGKRKKMSAEARAKISAAAKARWAEKKGEGKK